MAEANKYAKNANIDPNSKLETFKAFVSFGLTILALVGITVDMFKGEDFFKSIFADTFKSTESMLIIPVVAVVLWFLNKMMSSPSAEKQNKLTNLPLYILMAIGAYYLFRLITTGGF